MDKPKILMIHRVSGEKKVEEQYYKRNLVVSKQYLFDLIDTLNEKGYIVGSISDVLHDEKRYHLTFDDGYKEHFEISEQLMEKFSMRKDHCTFCINVGNSIFNHYSGMDLIYYIVDKYGLDKLSNYFNCKNIEVLPNIQSIKEIYITLSPEEIEALRIYFSIDKQVLDRLFLNESEIMELSNSFNIASHGMSHRDLRNHIKISENEMSRSKEILEKIIGSKVQIMCYPEGKNNISVQRACKDSAYRYGLSINHEEGNPYSIGRYCINRHVDEFMRGLNE